MTIVTHNRHPHFRTDENRSILRAAFVSVRENLPFQIPAIVLLPDHLHMLMELPRGETDYSKRIGLIKSRFTTEFAKANASMKARSASRQKRGEHSVWQRRFYEYTVRDEDDLIRCADYIHVNPVKHKFVKSVADWPWSSFHRWVRIGHYSEDWGGSDEWFGDEFEKWE